MTALEEMIDNGGFLKTKESCSLSSQIILEPGMIFTGKQGSDLLALEANARSEQFCLL